MMKKLLRDILHWSLIQRGRARTLRDQAPIEPATSGAIRLSLISFRDNALSVPAMRLSAFFLLYDFGEGGDAIGPARESRCVVKDKLAQQRRGGR